jgi:thiosulfate/3-mercaptopyruvate sulfurtransferase
VVFYGDKNNWWACYAFWVFQLFGHTNARVMDGGRIKWEKEGRPLTRDVPSYTPTTYTAPSATTRRRTAPSATRCCARGTQGPARGRPQPRGVRGERLHMPDYPNEGALRGGHIPGAKSIPWARAVNPDDGTFKTGR